MDNEVLLTIRALHKSFGPTVALKGVDLDIRRGEIRGLVGENGSGKSTVMSIACGMQGATSGEMQYHNQPWKPKTMVEAQRAGLSMILQEANTIPHVSVAQNLFAGREERFAVCGVIRMRRMYKEADEMLRAFGVQHIRARQSVDELTFEDCKLVELVRCVTADTQLLVVDETTTALSHEGRALLYGLMHRMADEGKAVVFVSHDMDEILEHCTVLTVLRDGEIIGHLDKAAMLAPDAVKTIRYMMVGREIGEKYYREDTQPTRQEAVALTLENISFGAVKNFSLTLHKGEIVGLGGLGGSGMHEVARAAYGLERLTQGRVLCGATEVKSCLDAIQNGIGYISKNRDTEALILEASIEENITLPSLPALSYATFISPAKEKALAGAQIEAFRIKCANGGQWANTLSGGNKQKVSFAKWAAKGSEIIIMDCPTRGVDIGVKQAMYAMIEDMKRAGKAILMVSEELPELLGMADRIVMMKDFAITKTFERSAQLSQTDLIECMI